MSKLTRFAALALLGAVGLGLMLPMPAEASKEGRRNTAIGLGAVAAYGVVKKKPVLAGVAGGAALYSYTRSRQSTKKKRRPAKVVHHYHRRPSRVWYCRKHHKAYHPCKS